MIIVYNDSGEYLNDDNTVLSVFSSKYDLASNPDKAGKANKDGHIITRV